MYNVIVIRIAARHDGRLALAVKREDVLIAPDLTGGEVYDHLTLDELSDVLDAVGGLSVEKIGRWLALYGHG